MSRRTNVPMMPPDWVEKLKKKSEIRTARKEITLGPGTTPWGRARLDALAEEVSEAQVGTRNHTLNKAAFLTGGAISTGHIDEDDAQSILYDAAIAAGLPAKEAMKTISSGLASGAQHPAGPSAQSQQAVHHRQADPNDEMGLPCKPTHLLVPGDPWSAIDAGSQWLTSHPDVYSQQGRLVTVYNLTDSVKLRHATVPSGLCRVSTIQPHNAWDCISQIGTYIARGKKGVERPVDPPMAVVNAILARHIWQGSRELTGISNAPLVLADGTIFGDYGYNEKTGMFVACKQKIDVPTSPTRRDAEDAVATLRTVVVDFPWRSPADEAGWIAALLTVITRHLCPTVPLYVFDASTPGTGKSLAVKAISAISCGGLPTTASYTKDEDEFRKLAFSLLLSGTTMVLVDNVPNGGHIGLPTLDMLLTSPVKTDRILSQSRDATVPNNITWVYTGNNVTILGDTGRRAIHIRLDTVDERPELRAGFVHDPLLGWIGQNRSSLLGAALTIVSAYLQAGRPDVEVSQIGSFEEWSRIIPSSLVWAGMQDPTALLAASSADVDPQTVAHIAVLEALTSYTDPLTCRQIIGLCDGDDALRCAILELCPARGDVLPTTRRLGHKLRTLRDRIRTTTVGTLKLASRQDKHAKILEWYVVKLRGIGGIAGYANLPSRVENGISDRIGGQHSTLNRLYPANVGAHSGALQDTCQESTTSGEKQQEIFPGVTREEVDW